MRCFMISTLHQIELYYGDRIKEDDMGGECITQGQMRNTYIYSKNP
jgi:hypothetical protein